MNKSSKFSKGLVSALFAAIVLTFSACSTADSNMEYMDKEVADSKKENSTAVNPYTLVLKAFSGKKDVTTKGDVNGVTLFVFDENYEYVETKEIDKATVLNRRTIQIAAPNSEKITVIAWAGLTNNKEEVSSLNQNNILSDLRVQLKQNNGQVTSPSDLFYGQISIDRASMTRSEETPVLNIERKVAEFALTTTGISRKFGNTEGDFYYIIRTSTSTINHNGEFTGEEVEYVLPATINELGNLVVDNIAVLPSDNVTIELYRNDIMVLSSKNVKNTENLSIKASEQLDIVFDAYKTNMNLIVAAWGQVVARVNVG